MRPLAEVGGEDAVVGRVALVEVQAVARAQQHLREGRRAGVLREPAAAVELAHPRDIVGQRRRQTGRVPEPADAVAVLGVALRVVALERVAAGAGVGVEQGVGLGLERHVAQHLHQHQVLEHVGVVAGMEGVAVGEHGAL